MPKFLRQLLVLLVGVLSLTVSKDAAVDASVDVGGFSEEECYVSGLVSKMRCYSFERPVSGSNGDTITLGGVIVPSDAVVPEPDPLVILAGGPGQAASDMAAMMTQVFRVINNSRDLIFFDIRGTGKSTPVNCEDDGDVYPLTHVGLDRIIELVQACHAEHSAVLKGATTRQAAADLEALRLALGVEHLNLWGGSYGTRLAQVYMQMYPGSVRSAVLDAVVPFEPSYVKAQPTSAETALQQVTAACMEDTVCNLAFPEFDANALLDQVETGRSISYLHPVTGEHVNTQTSRDAVVQALFTALYAPESRVFVPYALSEAVLNDNWAPLAILGTDTGEYLGMTTIYLGAFLGITCAEERDAIYTQTDAVEPFMQGYAQQVQQALCSVWQTQEEKLPIPEAGEITAPVFMISGGIDPITPSSLAISAEVYFQNVRHFVLPNGGHINSPRACVNEFLSEFVKNPADQTAMPNCARDGHVPSFVVGPTGPFSVGGVR